MLPVQQMERAAAVSELRVRQGQFLWTIKSFSKLADAVGNRILSPQFQLLACKWHLELYPGGHAEEHKGYLSVFVFKDSKEAVRASYKMVCLCSSRCVFNSFFNVRTLWTSKRRRL